MRLRTTVRFLMSTVGGAAGSSARVCDGVWWWWYGVCATMYDDTSDRYEDMRACNDRAVDSHAHAVHAYVRCACMHAQDTSDMPGRRQLSRSYASICMRYAADRLDAGWSVAHGW